MCALCDEVFGAPKLSKMAEIILSALAVFVLRIIDISLYTLRLRMMARGHKTLIWILSFCQAMVYVVALRLVFTDLGAWNKVIGYSAGYATGLVVGIIIEERMAIGFTHLRIISPTRGAQITDRLRSEGYGVTEVAAQGKDGMVTLLNCNILRKNANSVERIVLDVDPQAFVITQAVRAVQHGYWRSPHNRYK